MHHFRGTLREASYPTVATILWPLLPVSGQCRTLNLGGCLVHRLDSEGEPLAAHWSLKPSILVRGVELRFHVALGTNCTIVILTTVHSMSKPIEDADRRRRESLPLSLTK